MTDTTQPASTTTASDAILAPPPPAIPVEPPEKSELEKLRSQNNALLTLIGTLLLRSNNTLVLLQPHRRKYFDLVAKLGHQPLVDVQLNKRGDLIMTLVTAQPTQQVVEPMVPLFEIETMLQDADVNIEYEKLETLSPGQQAEAVAWAGAKLAAAKGYSVKVPPKPKFLTALESSPPIPDEPPEVTAGLAEVSPETLPFTGQ